MVMSWCLKNLKEPGTDDVSIDSPESTIARWQLIRDKLFLRQIYIEWYQAIASAIAPGELPVLEIGSGAGFMSDYVPDLITSDILPLPTTNLTVDACQTLPFADNSLRGIAMVNVFHHLPNCEAFLAEAQRCLAPGGTISMVEPWITTWSSLIYCNLHHEPCIADAVDWTFESTGPLSGANQALPWIVVSRDRVRFESQFPNLQIAKIDAIMPLRYLLSGGLSYKAFVPFWSYNFWVGMEKCVEKQMAMFAHIVLRKTG